MLLVVADALPPDEVADLRATLGRMRFADGRATAGGAARRVKSNEQAREGPALATLRDRVGRALLAHPLFDLAVRPRALAPLLFARYGPGQAYGSHVDEPLMRGVRTDVSFTLFLAEPEAYGGGELVLESSAGEDAYKLPAGHLVLYPTTMLHRVAPVSAGERLVCVGWAQSWVRDAQRREILFDLDTARRDLFAREGGSAAHDLLAKASANLVRMWAE